MEAILREKEREDKLQSAKRKLKSYRARQQSKSGLSAVPSSPSSKRTSVVAGTLPPSSPLKKGSFGHAHRRSSSRAGSISVIMPSSAAAAANGHSSKRSSLVLNAASANANGSTSTTMHNRRNSTRRHSRNISISITANAEPAIVSSATSSTRSPFPYSSSSPSLSSQLGSGSASSMAQTPSSPFQRRQSVPVQQQQQQQQHQHFTNSAAPASRVLSPNTSPVLQQGQQQQSAQPAHVSPFMARRSSLQMPKSPSFFEAQQLQAASASAGSAAPPPAHARRPSRHTRRTSVATRRESMEIMSGVSMSFLAGSASPDPNSTAASGAGNYVSTTGQFLATSSEMGSRSNTANSDSSFVTAATAMLGGGISNSFANFSWPAPSGSSVNMEDRSMSTSSDEEEERKNALSALEGRLRTPSEPIELPSLDALSLPTTTMTKSSSSGSNTAQNGSSRESKRASWNGNTIANIGGKGATNLGMLVEEEEEEEEEEAEEGNDSLSPLPISAATSASSAVPAGAVARSTSPLASSTGTKRQRPSSLIFPPPRSLPFGGSSTSAYSSSFGGSSNSKPESPLSPTGGEQTGGYSSYSSPRPSASASSSISPASGRSTGGGPRPLSLSAAASPSSVTGASDTSMKSARRLSGLRSLTLTSPEHVLNRQLGDTVSPGAGTGSPLPSSTSLRNFGKRHSVAAVGTGNTSIASSAAADRSSTSQSSRRISTTSISSSALSSSIGPSAGTTPAKNNLQRTSYTSGASGRRFSDFTTTGGAANGSASASASAQAHHHHHLGFGELVMEDMSIPEVDEQDLARVDEEDEEDVHDKSSDLLNVDHRPALARSTSSNASNTSGVTSDDPVILGMQVQALRSQMEHLRSENAILTSSLASAEAARTSEVSSLREELAELRESSAGIEEERESLREDVDGWRERCSGLERALREERERADDERREGLLLRDKVRKLSSRLEQQQQVGTSDGSQNGEDQALAAAQAKLIGEMRDQIFSLAAALERERLNKVGGSASSPVISRTASPLLRALEGQEDSQIAPIDSAPAASACKAAAAAAPSVGRHHNESATSSTASSYNFSSFSGSTYSVGNATEDTSIASADECDSVFGGKSPSSPAFSSSTYSSYASSSVGQGASNGISIHGTSMPLRRDDSSAAFGAIGGLQTLAEEDEEETEEEESTEEFVEEDNFYNEDAEEDEEQEVLNAGGCSSGEEGNGGVPELVADDAQRSRTQSGSVSTDASEGMPLTPAKEQPIAPAKATHLRSHSFIRQWAFPSGSISSSYSPEEEESQQDSFWNMRLSEAPLPPLPVKEDYLSAAPFSAEISFDEDLFSNAFAKHSQAPLVGNRPPSLLLHNGPPPARSSGSARLSYTSDVGVLPDSATALSTPSTAATPSTAGSRLSLQGFSSLWGWKSSSTPATAPLPVVDPVAPVVPPKSAGFVQQPKISTAVGGATKRLLKLEPSPLSRLDFTKSCSCEHGGARIIRL